MIHWLTIGHLEPEALTQLKIKVVKSLDMELVMKLLREFGTIDEKGNAWLQEAPVKLKDGYVSCLWLGAIHNRVAEDFARRLQVETGCMVADVGHGGIVDLESIIRHRCDNQANPIV